MSSLRNDGPKPAHSVGSRTVFMRLSQRPSATSRKFPPLFAQGGARGNKPRLYPRQPFVKLSVSAIRRLKGRLIFHGKY